MRKLFTVLTVPLILIGCSGPESNLNAIISQAEANAEQRQINRFAADCDAPDNDAEIALTYNALKTATNSTDCVALGKNIIGMQELNLSGTSISSLTPLAAIPALSVLNLADNRIADISLLADLTNLTSLNIADNAIEDLSPLASLVTLASLDASKNQVVDVTALSGLFNLIALDLNNNRIDTIGSLSALEKVVDFQLRDNVLGTTVLKTASNCPQEDGTAVAIKEYCQQRNQVKPFIAYCENYDNESAAIRKTLDKLKGFQSCAEAEAQLSGLRKLDLTVPFNPAASPPIVEADRLTDISPIASFTNIEELNLNYNRITNVEPVSRLTNLRSLNMQGNGIVDISSLSYLTKLVKLDLAINKVVNIDSVRSMSLLTALLLNMNEVVDVSPVEDLEFISGLGLESNQVVDPTPIGNLVDIFVVDLSFNKIQDFSALAGLRGLTQFTIECNTLGRTLAHAENLCPTGNAGAGLYTESCTKLANDDMIDQNDNVCPAIEASRHVPLRAILLGS